SDVTASMAVTSKISVPLLLFYFIVFVFSSKLNVPRVLLPYKTSISTNYTLEVTDGGCYRWSSSRPEVATITPISDGDLDIECAKKAVVSAVSTSASRQSTIILASDEASDTVLKCDVIVDAIHSVEIVTTTRELFLDDAPEAFEVIAKNDQEDTFTNIDGIAFDWKLESKRSTTSSVLRFLTFEASPYETPPSIYQWEREGLKGSIVLVEGIGTGVASVSVQLQDLRYKHVPAVTVTLIVVANLMLNPAHDVYILPECKVHYKVELIKQGRPHEIKMPSDQYYLEIKNDNIVLLDSKNSHVSGLSIGSTQIVLHDKHTADLEAFRQPTAGIHVVTAHHLGFDVRPGHNWVLQTATVYEITIRLFDIDNHEIHPSDNIRLDVKFQEKYFKVLSSSKNGTYHVVSTKILGKTKINAKLTSVVSKALGGSGSYSWKSSNTSVFQIKKDGTFVTQGPGVAQLTVFDANNKWNYDTLKISVIEVGDLEVLPGAIETIVD
ncbi:NUP210 (predicted), partial [Pycnogonum litorale]